MKGKIPLVIALILSVMAGFFVVTTIEYHRQKAKEGWNLVSVVVADVDIEAGREVRYEMLAKQDVPEQFVNNYVVLPEQANDLVGQELLVPLHKGDPVQWTYFRAKQQHEGMGKMVKKFARAVSIQVTGAQSVGGWVRPNDHVDILGTFDDPKTGNTGTVTLLQNVIVLATGSMTSVDQVKLSKKPDQQYTNVTVMVLPEEARILVLASKLGTLHLTLRRDEDISREDEKRRATVDTLLTGEWLKQLQEKREQTFQIIRLPAERGKEGRF